MDEPCGDRNNNVVYNLDLEPIDFEHFVDEPELGRHRLENYEPLGGFHIHFFCALLSIFAPQKVSQMHGIEWKMVLPPAFNVYEIYPWGPFQKKLDIKKVSNSIFLIPYFV